MLFTLILNLLVRVDCLTKTLHSFEEVMAEESGEEFIELCLWFSADVDQISEYEHRHVF